MLAHLQRVTTLALLAAAGGWVLVFHKTSPWLAAAGFVAIAFGYAGFLALEFMLLVYVNRNDPAPKARWRELLGAWAGETWVAPQVFCWRQPFRANAVPDVLGPPAQVSGRRGVVFIHGFFCNRGIWTPWLRRLQSDGRAFVALSLEPVFGSIDGYAAQIDSAVERVTLATGLAPLVVCHSMGGLAVRAWLKGMKSEARVHHIVTIGSPHRGTWLARFGHGHNGRQMRLLSEWQTGLDQDMPASRHALFTCWYSNCDNIVFPASTATLDGASNRLVRGKAHVQMAFTALVMDQTLKLLETNC